MGKLGLALLEMEEARRARPDDPRFVFVYLDLLRLEDLPSAVSEAETIAESPDVPALVLSACINILATQAEQAADDQFELDRPGESSPCVSGSIRPRISIKRSRRSWPCLTSTEDSCSFERAESLRLGRRSNAPTSSIP